MKPEPTPQQLDALYRFRAANGGYWKAKLRDLWLTERCPPLLQQVRNQLGPQWLSKWRP